MVSFVEIGLQTPEICEKDFHRENLDFFFDEQAAALFPPDAHFPLGLDINWSFATGY